jgi:glycosyltransferase involved in cell wall biosynthesis
VEAFPLVIIEAMASRTPFISFEVGALRKGNEEFDGGIIVNTIEEMVKAIQYLLKKDLLRQQFGRAGYQCTRKRFNITKIAERYETLYKRLV